MEYKRKARERLTSEKGLGHRSKRPIEPEAVFGQMKYDMGYRRFRHFGKDKVTMDFAFFAIAFNLKKMVAKMRQQQKLPTNGGNFAIYIAQPKPIWSLEMHHNTQIEKNAA